MRIALSKKQSAVEAEMAMIEKLQGFSDEPTSSFIFALRMMGRSFARVGVITFSSKAATATGRCFFVPTIAQLDLCDDCTIDLDLLVTRANFFAWDEYGQSPCFGQTLCGIPPHAVNSILQSAYTGVQLLCSSLRQDNTPKACCGKFANI